MKTDLWRICIVVAAAFLLGISANPRMVSDLRIFGALLVEDDIEIEFGDGSDFRLNYDDPLLEITDGTNVLATVTDNGSSGSLTTTDSINMTRDADALIALIMTSYRDSDSTHTPITLQAAKGGGSGSAAVCGSATLIGGVTAKAWDGDSWNNSSQIKFQADGAQGADDTPGLIGFAVSPDGSSTLATAMTISENKEAQFFGDLVTATKTPSGSGDTGTAGTIAWDSSYLYVCTATNTWTRVSLAW
jgi:hypothetical protein